MLSSRYVHLHEALELGPMWLKQGAHVHVPMADGLAAAASSEQKPGITATAVAATATAATSTGSAAKPVPGKSLATATGKHTAAREALLLTIQGRTPKPVPAQEATLHPVAASTKPSALMWPLLQADTLNTALHECQRCYLYQQRCQPLAGHGSLKAKVVVVSPNPSIDDDMNGQLMSGEAGQLLRNMLLAAGIDEHDVYITSQVKCTPNASLKIAPEATAACTPVLQQQLDWIQPQAVLFLGQVFEQQSAQALAELTGHRPYAVIPHPARLLRQSALKAEAWQVLQTLKAHWV